MKKLFSFLFFIIFLSSCSFDNKTGIWKDSSDLEKIKKKHTKNIELKDVFVEDKIFDEEKEASPGTKIEIDYPFKTKNWTDIYFNLENNISNIYYENSRYLVFKSSKMSKSSENKDFLFYNNNIISTDNKGRIYVYSLEQKKKIFEYNFYKNKFKKYRKEINIAISGGKIYASDNLGYIYVIEINSGKLIWAKYFGIPFRSNIKIVRESIFLANEDNKIYCLKSSNGEKIWEFATSLTKLKSVFKNNIAVNEKNNNVFFLNTSGELYSINYLNQGINWFVNLKNEKSILDTSLFLSSPLVIGSNKILVSSGNFLLNYDSLSGKEIWKHNMPIRKKITLTKKNIFLFTKNNFLICLDFQTGQILWSKNILKEIRSLDKKNLSKKIMKISNLIIANNQIFLFSSEGYLLSFDYKSGKIQSVEKILKSGLGSRPIIVNGNMYLLDKSNRLFQYK